MSLWNNNISDSVNKLLLLLGMAHGSHIHRFGIDSALDQLFEFVYQKSDRLIEVRSQNRFLTFID
jgi:hypothetical protein